MIVGTRIEFCQTVYDSLSSATERNTKAGYLFYFPFFPDDFVVLFDQFGKGTAAHAQYRIRGQDADADFAPRQHADRLRQNPAHGGCRQALSCVICLKYKSSLPIEKSGGCFFMRLRRGSVNALTNRIHIMYNDVGSRGARFYLAESTRWVCRLA